MTRDPAPTPQVRLERTLSAPIDAVFAAWTDPAAMAKWFSPTGQAEVEAEARVGGLLRVVMLGDGVRIEHEGEYRTVDPPRLLSFTWRSQYTGDAPSLVTVSLTEAGSNATLLVLTHEQLPDGAVESHAGGWGGIIERLADHIGAA